MQNSPIEWTHHTFNPWWGCQRVSEGCTHCYAETLANRYGHAVWGPAKTTQRRAMSESYWRQPLRWNEAARKIGQRARVFCASMADVFEDHPQVGEWRMRLWDVIHLTPWLDWLLLTKRPENVMSMIPIRWLDRLPDNIWLGTSVENQEYADKRVPELLKVPARARFLSCEPLLGPVDVSRRLLAGFPKHIDRDGRAHGAPLNIHWVIVGGESGHGARPMHPDWARALRDQCQAASVSFFFKQWGEGAPACAISEADRVNGRQLILDRTEPIDYSEQNIIYRVGKKAAGRLLDGREWNEFPL